MTEDICPICKRAKASGGAGSITQWIVACQCGIQELADDNNADQILLCRTCGKRMDEGRLGSITQFIFRSDSCRCKVPKSLDEAFKESARLTSLQTGIQKTSPEQEQEQEEELTLDSDEFPIERYKPLIELGGGASGVVYLARDRVLNKRVAIKVLRVVAADMIISFQEEARTTNKLKHKYIVDLLDFGVTPGGSPYMVLEHVVGPSLSEAINQVSGLTLPDFFSVFKRVCEALSYAHRNSVFHRDLKPGNILLTTDADGTFGVRIIDFGLARILSNDLEHGHSKGMTLAGTPLYMSPDQGLGRVFDARSEIYSLGCVMFEALTGNAPFEAEGALELLSMHAEKQPPTLADAANQSLFGEQQKSFPPELERLIQKCLEKIPDDRYQTMDELNEALKIAESACNDEIVRESENQTETQLSKRSGQWIYIGLALSMSVFIAFSFFVGTRMNEPTVEKDNHDSAMQVRPKFTERFRSLKAIVPTNSEIVKINAGLSDDEFKELKLYKNARVIDISNNLISDQAISYINSPNLQTLRVNNTNVSSLEYVPKLKSLRKIDVGGSSVNGTALDMLTSLPNLDELDIRKTEIRDEDLYKLLKLKTLTKVDYHVGDFSDAALRKLVEEMPGCRFGQRPSGVPFKSLDYMISSNQYKKYQPEIKKSIEIIAAAQGEDAPLLANYYFYQGLAFYRENQFDEAKESLERSREISKKTGYTRYLDDVQSYLRALAERG